MLLLSLASAALGATFTVCPVGCDAADIAGAVGLASDGDTIEVSAGTYTSQVIIGALDLTIVAVDGPGTVQVVSVENMIDVLGDSTVTIDGLSFCPGPRALRVSDASVVTVRNALFDGCVGSADGIAIQVRDVATLDLTDSIVSNNDASAGGHDGAVRVEGDAQADFARVVFDTNYADRGAALDYIAPTSWALEDVTFTGNTADSIGGALRWFPQGGEATAVWTNVVFEGNQASGQGGAVYVRDTVQLTWSGGTLRDNTGGDGGAAYMEGVTLTVDGVVSSCNASSGSGGALWVEDLGLGSSWSRSVFHDNTAAADGGAVNINATELSLVNVDVLGNVAQASGGGVYTNGGSVDIRNTVFAWNGPGAGLFTNGSAASMNYNLWFDNTATDLGGDLTQPGDFGVDSLVGVDPLLLGVSNDGNCFNDDYAPDPASPLIDAGDPSLLDADGSRSDIGSFVPVEPPACAGDPTTGDTDGDGVCDDIDVCTGDDATGDGDNDGVCDDLDACSGDDSFGDTDGDGVCEDIDVCTGDDAEGDTDGDGICEGDDACVGNDSVGDSDGDGVCDDLDLCLGDDTAGDADTDGICDDDDVCFGNDAVGDTDGDGVCDDLDLCLGDDAEGDADVDGICDGDDVCFGDDGVGDTDGDGVCDDLDLCLGDDAEGDADVDGICDGDDVCFGDDSVGDSDGDGVCDDRDACAGDDSSGDSDGDGICDDSDTCVGDDASGDADGDGVCDDLDLCLGDDATGDSDGDGVCNDDDACTGDDASGDSDGDGVCDDLDVCAGADSSGDTDGDGICDDDDLCFGDNASGDSDGDGICDAAEDEDQDGSVAGDDCDDNDAARYPGAYDIPDDGIDQNCNGFDAALTWGSGGGCGCQAPVGGPQGPWWLALGLVVGLRRVRRAA